MKEIVILCFGIALLLNEWICQVNGEHFEEPADKYKEYYQKQYHQYEEHFQKFKPGDQQYKNYFEKFNPGDQQFKEHFQNLTQNITTFEDLEAFIETATSIQCRMTLDYIMYYFDYLDYVYGEDGVPEAFNHWSKEAAVTLEEGCDNFELPLEMEERIIHNRHLRDGKRSFRTKSRESLHKPTDAGYCRRIDDLSQWCNSFLDVAFTALEAFVNTEQYMEKKGELQILYEECQALNQSTSNTCQTEKVKQEICVEKNTEYLQNCIRELVAEISILPVQEYFLQGDEDVLKCLAAAMSGQSTVRCVVKVCGKIAGNSAKEEFEGRLDKLCLPDMRKFVAEWVPITTDQ